MIQSIKSYASSVVVQALEEKCLFEKMGASGLHKVFECMPDYNPIVGADAGTPQASYQVCEQWFTCSNGPAPSAVLPLVFDCM